jgi:small subunit ribosomal protein S6
MFIVKPDLSDEKKESVFKDISNVVEKNKGKIINQQVWAQKRRFAFSIRKYNEGVYYLLQFDMDPSDIVKLRQTWKLNEDILRFQVLKAESE